MMKIIESDFTINHGRNSPIGELVEEFEKSNMTQVEIIDWKEHYATSENVRLSAIKFIKRNHYKIKVSRQKDRVFLYKEGEANG